MFKALTNVAPSQLCDTQLFDFLGLDSAAETVQPAAPEWLMPGRRGSEVA